MNAAESPDDPVPSPDEVLEDLNLADLMDAGLPYGATVPVRPGQWEPPTPEELSGQMPGYEIKAFLGRGGMGAVYKAIQTNLEREVAIKLLPPELGADPTFEARFRREAKSMARLNHPNIVQIYDYGQTPAGQHYFVMEFVDGSDLRQFERTGRLDAEGALNAVGQLCDALQYAHEQGFVHRDIKPANVLINRQGTLKIGDFGLAKLVGESLADPAEGGDLMGLTLSGAIVGTPLYAAPEQLDGHSHIDHRADLYSLGVMFYEMLTGEIPRGSAKAPSSKVAALDVRIDGVVFKAMEHDPDERYQRAVDLRSDVDYIRSTPLPLPEDEEPPAVAAPPVVRVSLARPDPPSEQEILATTRSLNSTMLVLGFVALLTLGGLAAFLATRETGDVTRIETTISNKETHNTYFTQLIASGLATEKDLEVVADIRPYAGSFVAISKQEVTWEKAQVLATQTGAEILTLEDSDDAARQQLVDWIRESYEGLLNAPAWLREKGEGRLLEGETVLSASTKEVTGKVFLQWRAAPSDGIPGTAAAKRDTDQNDATGPQELQGEAARPEVETLPDGDGDPDAPATSDPIGDDATPDAAPDENPAATPEEETVETPPPSGPLEWISADGRSLQAEFIQLSGEAVVVRKDGKPVTIKFSQLSPASVEQAKRLGGRAP